jgi:hypothetical protein
MARSISVYREAAAEPLYEQPLGSESAIREWWSEPATVLGLPLIASLYEHGFYSAIRWAGPDLTRALRELATLEAHWMSAGLPPEAIADLAERASYLRAAVAKAKECGGFVDIG